MPRVKCIALKVMVLRSKRRIQYVNPHTGGFLIQMDVQMHFSACIALVLADPSLDSCSYIGKYSCPIIFLGVQLTWSISGFITNERSDGRSDCLCIGGFDV